MRWAVPLFAFLLAMPVATAWPAEVVAAPTEVSLQESLLLAGEIRANASSGHMGSPTADRLLFDVPVSVLYCPDRANARQDPRSCAGGEPNTGARLYVRAGGLAVAAPDAEMSLLARASAAALGGPNVTVNRFAIGAGVFVGGTAIVVANGTSFEIRPIGSGSSLEIRGDAGFSVYNGTGYSLHVAQGGEAFEARLESRGAFLAGDALDVSVGRAGLRRAEQSLRVTELYQLLQAIQPPDRADRRSAVAGAFGIFQIVPGLLDGAMAGATNLSLNGERRAEFAFVRVSDLRLGHDGVNWTGSGNGTYMIDGNSLQVRPESDVTFPVLVPIVLLIAAIGARFFTTRAAAPKKRRILAHVVRAGALVILSLLAASTLAPLLGFSPLLDAPDLALRSRVQLFLLVEGMVVAAYLVVGFPAESLARSLFSWRERPKALLLPATIGGLATLVFILFATPVLLSAVARVVRL